MNSKPHVSRCRCGCLDWVVTAGEPECNSFDEPANGVTWLPTWRDAFDFALTATVGIRLREKGLV